MDLRRYCSARETRSTCFRSRALTLAQKSKVKGIQLHINLAIEEMTKAEVAKAKAEKDTIKLKSTIEANEVALQEMDMELVELKQHAGELRNSINAAQSVAGDSAQDLDAGQHQARRGVSIEISQCAYPCLNRWNGMVFTDAS